MIADVGQTFEDEIAAADRALAGLPLEILTVCAAGRTWTLEAVRDQDRLLEAADGLATFPFGLLLWESAIVLADVLAGAEGGDDTMVTGGRLSGLTVLELGAGTGLCGLAAAVLGASVVQSDHSAEALALCRRNALANGVTGVTQRFGDWTDWRDETRYDLVIGADILYEPSLYGALVRVMDAAVTPGRPVLLTDPTRTHTPRFIADLEADGWQVWQPMRRLAALPPARPGETVPVNVIVARRPVPPPRLAEQAVEDEALVRLGGGALRAALAAFGGCGLLGRRRLQTPLDAAAGHACGEQRGDHQTGEGPLHGGGAIPFGFRSSF